MYNPDIDIIENPETGINEIYYSRFAQLPLTYNFDNFNYIAVFESDVPADHIFGAGDNNTEVM